MFYGLCTVPHLHLCHEELANQGDVGNREAVLVGEHLSNRVEVVGHKLQVQGEGGGGEALIKGGGGDGLGGGSDETGNEMGQGGVMMNLMLKRPNRPTSALKAPIHPA